MRIKKKKSLSHYNHGNNILRILYKTANFWEKKFEFDTRFWARKVIPTNDLRWLEKPWYEDA